MIIICAEKEINHIELCAWKPHERGGDLALTEIKIPLVKVEINCAVKARMGNHNLLEQMPIVKGHRSSVVICCSPEV